MGKYERTKEQLKALSMLMCSSQAEGDMGICGVMFFNAVMR